MSCHGCTTEDVEMAYTERVLKLYFGDEIIISRLYHLLCNDNRLGWLVVETEFNDGEIAIINRLSQSIIVKELLMRRGDIVEERHTIPLPLFGDILRIIAGNLNILGEDATASITQLGVQHVA